MNLPHPAKLAPSWPLAVTFSLLLHGSLLLPCLVLSSAGSSAENAAELVLDTRAVAPVQDVRILLDKPPRVAPAPAPAASTQPMAASVAAPRCAAAHGPSDEHATVSSGAPEPASAFLRDYTRAAPTTAQSQPVWSGNPASGSGREAERGKPGTGTTTFFQIATQAQAIVYVVDRSASMGLNGCLAAAKRELLASLERLPPSACFQVVVYNRSAGALRINGHSGLVRASAENKRYVARLLEEIPAEGGTEHLQALRQALALGPQVIFFLTDAADLPGEQIRAITLLNRGRCVIHAIELLGVSAASGMPALAALAQENRGCYRCVAVNP